VARHLIAVDWGTTSLRAYVVDPHGRILDSNKSGQGIQSRKGDFEATLGGVINALDADDDAPVLMAGMIGSRQGWIEAPYIETPCDVQRIARQLTDVGTSLGRPVKIVPGLCDLSGPAPDVMRGEETKLLGLFGAGEGGRFETVCMPGTHGKWVAAKDGRILGFKTYMTGEVFGLLCEHSILGRLMPASDAADEADWQAFDTGLARAGDADHLLHQIFSARTLGLFDRLPAASLKSYLSGLLIGHETCAASAGARGPVALIGDARLAARYERALSKLGVPHERADEDIVIAGLAMVARSAGLVCAGR
jgi:2-dehydro-3-deoxygalactonokinase